MNIKNIAYLLGVISFALFASSFSSYSIDESGTDDLLTKTVNKDFAEFLSKFEKTELPYAIPLEKLTSYTDIKPFAPEYKNILKTSEKTESKTSFSQFLPGLGSGKFSRMSPPKYIPISRFYVRDKVIAVVFKTKSIFSLDDFCGYSMMLYDLKGNILSEETQRNYRSRAMYIGGHQPYSSMSFSIDTNGILTTRSFVPTWEKDVKEFGYVNNVVSEFTLSKISSYKIEKNGVIKEVPTPEDYENKLIAEKDRC